MALVGGEVVLDPLLGHLCYLLLARPGAAGEDPPFGVARDKDGLGDGRRQAVSCAAAPGAKAVVARRPAARTAASTDAHTFKNFASAIPQMGYFFLWITLRAISRRKVEPRSRGS